MGKKAVATAAGPRSSPIDTERYTAPALEKGLDILELFAREAGGMIKSEVARRLNRTTSEVFRMLICLQRRGYISQGPDERYRLTLRLFELAQQHPPPSG